MVQTFNDFIKECELFEHSKQYFELLKEASEISLMEKYVEDQQFIAENAIVLGDMNLNESYMPAADTAEKIKQITEAAEEKKKGFWAKVWAVISAPFRALISFFKKIIDKITRKAELKKLEEASAKFKARADLSTAKAHEYYAELLGLRDDAKSKDQKIAELKQKVREIINERDKEIAKHQKATGHIAKLKAENERLRNTNDANKITFSNFVGCLMTSVTPSGMSFAMSAFDGLKTLENVKALYEGAPATIFFDSEDKILINPRELANIFAVATSEVDTSKNAAAINKVASEIKAAQSKYNKAASIIKKSKKVDVVLSVQELKECLDKLQATYKWYSDLISNYSPNQAVDQMNRSEAGITNYTDVLTVATDVQKKIGEQIAMISELLAGAQKEVAKADLLEEIADREEWASEHAS